MARTLLTLWVKSVAAADPLHRQGLCPVLRGGLSGKEVENGRDVCVCVIDSLCCAVESNNIVKQLEFSKFFFLNPEY